MDIVDLGVQPKDIRKQAAPLLVDDFNEPRGWPNLESAAQELDRILETGFALVSLEGGIVLGWIGGLPEYNGRVWELHPLVVRREYRRRGIGRALVAAFEVQAG